MNIRSSRQSKVTAGKVSEHGSTNLSLLEDVNLILYLPYNAWNGTSGFLS